MDRHPYYFEQPAHFIDVGTARIAYRCFGEGEPILFIHGWPFSGFVFRKVIAELSADYACYAIDLPGAGETEWRPGNDFTFHGHAENLRKLTGELGLDRYRIIAHDTGATTARRLAILEGQRVSQLVLIDTEIPNHRPPLVPFFQKLLYVPGSASLLRLLMRSKRFVRSSAGFGGCVTDPTLLEGEFDEHFVQPLARSRERMDGQVRYAKGIDWEQLDALEAGHREIQGEVLLIWGEHDPFFPIGRARQMVDQFADCRGLVEIPGTKLLPFEERPDLVNSHVRAFFES